MFFVARLGKHIFALSTNEHERLRLASAKTIKSVAIFILYIDQ